MPHEGKTQTIFRTLGKDNSRYLTFHNGGNFNIGCNVNTTIVASLHAQTVLGVVRVAEA